MQQKHFFMQDNEIQGPNVEERNQFKLKAYQYIGTEPVYKYPHCLTIYFTSNKITYAQTQVINLQSNFFKQPLYCLNKNCLTLLQLSKEYNLKSEGRSRKSGGSDLLGHASDL